MGKSKLTFFFLFDFDSNDYIPDPLLKLLDPNEWPRGDVNPWALEVFNELVGLPLGKKLELVLILIFWGDVCLTSTLCLVRIAAPVLSAYWNYWLCFS